MSSEIELWCWIQGDELRRAFLARINRSAAVTVLVTTSPTQLGLPRKFIRISKEFFLGRKPMKRMRLPQDCIFSHAFHFSRPKKKKNPSLSLRVE
jgi:hypothetical protein